MATPRSSRRPEGISSRHARHCQSRAGGNCDCQPTYQAQVFSPADRKTIRKTYRGILRAPTRTTLAEAAEEWLAAARRGVVRTRSGDPYKPSALRAYEQALRLKVLPALGHLRLSSVTGSAVQDLVDRLLAEGASASTVRNAVLPLRAIYRRPLSRSEVFANPTVGLSLPAVRGRRERVSSEKPNRAKLYGPGCPEKGLLAGGFRRHQARKRKPEWLVVLS